MDNTLLKLHKNIEDAKKALQDYIEKNEFKTCSYEEFKKIVSVFPVDSSIDSEFLDLLEKMLQQDIWEMCYSKYETVYFTDICVRITDCDYEEDISALCECFQTVDEQEAIDKAVDAIMQYALKTKSQGFKLDW